MSTAMLLAGSSGSDGLNGVEGLFRVKVFPWGLWTRS